MPRIYESVKPSKNSNVNNSGSIREETGKQRTRLGERYKASRDKVGDHR